MKVVLFCGGLGLRLRDVSDSIPKPMMMIGQRPVLWHVMKYYAHFGHKDFILCLGYRSEVIKNYFLNYSEAISNDFVLSQGGRDLQLLGKDIDDWRITFVETGPLSSIGQRLCAVRSHLERFRPVPGRPRPPAPGQGHRRLADHLRRDRPSLVDRPAALRGAQPSRG
jgi:glucose-1-phosphate cytidylyltransferase